MALGVPASNLKFVDEQSKYIKGKKSERIACDYLSKNNYLIIDKNWRSGKYGEIDIIAKDTNNKELVFVEVKSRTTSLNEAKELVNWRKQKHLYKLAKCYLYLKKRENLPCRFDVIAIKIDNKKQMLEHIKNAFYLT